MAPRLLKRSSKKDRRANDAGAEASRPASIAAHDFTETLGGYEPPSFPALVAQALDQLGDPMVDMAAVSTLVERDPGASARLLRLVNSASFSPRSKVTSIHQAAMMLGRNQLEALLISVGAHGVLPTPGIASFEGHRFWATAAKRAVLASRIAERTDPTRRSENFTAALLQDMAVPVLALRANLYGDLLHHWHHSTEDLAALETDNYGWHHGNVAGWMGASWNFPQDFVDFMSDHHGDASTLHLLPAQVVSPIREADTEGDEQVIEASSLLSIPPDDLRVMIDEAGEESLRLAELLR